MFGRFALSVALAAVALSGAPVHADTFKPVQAQKVNLGTLTGVAYYTEEADGAHVVLTLQAPESATPFRVVATLAQGQSVTLSVPRGAGEPPVNVRFTRRGGLVSMDDGAAAAPAPSPCGRCATAVPAATH
jgi:hypothetical protein